jgi:HlyD family secretion protein
LADMQVEVVIDESDVGRLQPGQTTRFTVDAFPGQTFEGKIAQLRKAPSNVANVVTYVAIVRFSNSKRQLLPGMTANVRVVTDTRENVWAIPNAALRVRIAQSEVPNSPGPDKKALAKQAPADKPSGTRGRIYVLDRQGQPQPVVVRLGVTDGRQTELLEVDEPRTAAWLQPGVQVVTQVQASADSGHAAGGAKPASAAPRLAW